MKSIFAIIGSMIAIVAAFAYKLAFPALCVMVAVKLFYKPFPLGWGATILIPLFSGIIGFVISLLFAFVVKGLEK